MRTLTLSDIEQALRASWDAKTQFATADYLARGAGRASRGQCGTTALVVQELLGGDLMVADLEHAGQVVGVHYWNVTSGGVEVDLTRDQLLDDESLVDVRRVVMPRSASAGERPFQVLRERVRERLDLHNLT
ncbi:hypothetical protein [Nocardioides sp. 1609]|uniref:YunG family protein n=1 Tax=Nocardioides sp. 1609 TaxID=2508327 RepID=UPI00106F3C66|nr:hypothetical protein [Nocardioides sp. 1609]